MPDKRKHPRVPVRSEIWLGQDGVFTKTQSTLLDLCEGGALIENPEGFQIGSVLSLRFTLPGSRHPISCAATVRNLRDGGTGLGVQFLDISEADRRLVGAFVGDKRPGSSQAST